MKSALKIWMVPLLIALYCSAIGFSNYGYKAGLPLQKVGKEAKYNSFEFSDLLVHLSVELLGSKFEAPLFPDTKPPFEEISFSSRSEQNQLRALFEQYNLISLNLQIEQHKADLIYPFHYFP